MRSFGNVDRKLEEADFFCDRLADSDHHLFDMRFYFSAFVSAARSTTFALQASLKGAPGFEEWYGKKQEFLRSSPLAKFFHECRTDSQHIGLDPIMSGCGDSSGMRFYFGQPEPSRFSYLPEEDVVTACRSYMALICSIIEDCYRDFGLLIDPDQIYTPAGLRVLGLTIEDVEAELGFPRGWTDIPWQGDDKDEQRLAGLRLHISRSKIKHLFEKYR